MDDSVNPETSSDQYLPVCPLPRRFAAIFYDILLLLSIFIVATFAILPLTGGAAISSSNFVYTIYLFLISYVYFAWQWLYGGQTLGMRAWKIRLVSASRIRISHLEVFKRYIFSLCSLILLGAGFFWAWFDSNHFTLHDRLSGTYPGLLVNDKKS